jgi:hypothetical protein
MTRLTVGYIAEVIPEYAYVATRDDLTNSRAVLIERLRQAEADSTAGVPAVEIRELLKDWEFLSVELRRAELRKWISAVLVTPGRPVGTVRIIPNWDEG